MSGLLFADRSPALPRGFSLYRAGELASLPVYLVPLGAVPRCGQSIPSWNVAWRGSGGLVRRTVVSREVLIQWACSEGDEILDHVMDRIRSCEAVRCTAFSPAIPGKPVVMGIVNVTPDSFSDGGDCLDTGVAIARGFAMLEAGAGIIDVGGESTRPGAMPVPFDEEIRRVIPVIRALANAGAAVSVDTRYAAVMEAAVGAGASIINDVSALRGSGSLEMAARLGKPVILMHMQGDPESMQCAPAYDCCSLDVFDALEERVAACRRAGIALRDICVDPGIGFGKSVRHNADILGHLGLYHGLGCTVALGVSRKSFVSHVTGVADPAKRLPGSLALTVTGWEHGVNIVRVHDVAETVQARDAWWAVRFSAE